MLHAVRVRLVAGFLVAAGLSSGPAFAQEATGVVSGRVIDGATGNPLPGAGVGVEGSKLATSTDRDGNFRLASVPGGARTLVVTYLGRASARATVEVVAGKAISSDVTMGGDVAYQETVTVSALIRDAQARALNQQKTAPNIMNIVSADQIGQFPDPNAAETTQRIPGVSIQRDQGEGRYVIVRGTEPRLNSTLIDGERIPAPEANVRQVALDVIPADLLQAVEVSKALTPDMDGDAIGGTVNLVMKQAPEKLRMLGSIGGGYNRSLASYEQNNASVTLGQRLMNNKVGVIFSGSTSATVRGNQDFEPVYAAGALTDLDFRDYVVTRRRRGATGAFDFRPDATSLYRVRTVYNYYIDDHEERQRLRNRLGTTRRLERELRDRTHVEHIWSTAFTGEHQFGRLGLDVHLSGAHADQRDPLTITTTFRQSNVNFLPNVSATSIDPDNIQANPQNESLAAYTFNQQVRATNAADERDVVASANARLLALTSTRLSTFLKFGFKVRDKDKTRTRDEVTLTSPTPITLAAAGIDDGAIHTLLDGRYTIGPFLSLPVAADLPSRFTMNSAINHARDTEDFTVGERVASAYGMAEIYVGSKLFILPGVRVEHTTSDFTGNDVTFAAGNGAWIATTPIDGGHSYSTVMPGVQMRYAARESTNLRVAFTRSLSRPNYFDLVPYRSFDDAANTVMLGNPALSPTLSWNTDVMLEHYLKSVGVLSAGVFHKRLTDYIYTFVSTQSINGETFTVTQAQNGEAATITGVELAAQSQLAFLPGPLKGLGVYLNYTFTDSSAEFPGRTGEPATLPGQSRHVGNVSVSYERGGFSGRLAVNFHGSYIDQVAAASGGDRFYDTHKQLDLSLGQKITRNVRVYLNALNLTDAPLRYFQGVADRPLQEEHYRWWMDFGVKLGWQ
jgi:TonB-dependent receptor